ncbi:MAG: hypothetical protein AB9873_17485 [Syntrophobacteraceae bacterium]
MLIDQFLPRFDTVARYRIDVHAPVDQVYAAARLLDMRSSWITRALFRLRGLPAISLTLDGMCRWGFVLLGERPPREIVFGLIGRFWTLSPRIQPVTPDSFSTFEQSGFAKVAGNLALFPDPNREGIVRVTTETRIRCLDAASRRRFRLYWIVVGPFSGLIRKEWLRLIKHKAEAGHHG